MSDTNSEIKRVLTLHTSANLRDRIDQSVSRNGHINRYGIDIGDLVMLYNGYKPNVIIADTPLHSLDEAMIINWLDQVGFEGCLVLTTSNEFLVLSEGRHEGRAHKFRIIAMSEQEFLCKLDDLIETECYVCA